MKLEPNQLDRINKLLADKFGIDTITGRAMWRLSWANDEFEHRYATYRDYSGDLFLREVTEMRYVPKYEDKDVYILEHLVIIPLIDERTLPTSKMSYEPLWTFHDRHGDPLLPTYEACDFICSTVLASMGKGAGNLQKYKDLAKGETKEERIQRIEKELFGNESRLDNQMSSEKVFISGGKNE